MSTSAQSFAIHPLDGQRVLITGGLGFIGSALARRCLSLGTKVTLFTRSLRLRRNIQDIESQVDVIEGDVRDARAVADCARGKDCVFHLAAQTSHAASMEDPKLDVDINCNGTLNVLEAIRRCSPKARMLFGGSVKASGPVTSGPLNESQKDHPVHIYGANMLVCEKYLAVYARAYGIHTVSLRFPNVFGDRQPLNDPGRSIVNFMIGRAILEEPITVYGDGSVTREYSYIENMVDACLCALQTTKTRGEVYFVGSGRGIAFKDMVILVNETVARVLGKRTKIVFVPFPENEKYVDADDYVVDSAKFRLATGWAPRVSFEHGLERTVESYKTNLEEYLE